MKLFKNKKRYKIYYSGILCYGYVTVKLIGKDRSITTEPATIFRSKFIANICCYLLNKSDDSFKTYKVVEVINDNTV